MSRHRIPAQALTITAGIGLLLALPAASQQGKTPKTQLWLDVATHSMAGMPSMGGLGGAAMRMFGGDAAQNHYGSARYAGMPGRYLDMALLNQLNPGKEAEDQIPAGMGLGASIPLLPPKAAKPAEPGGNYKPGMADGNAKARILIYWGCGTSVRPGQPREIKFEVQNGKVTGNTAAMGSAMQGRYAPDRTVDVDSRHALWPNEKHRKMVPDNGSLVGNHHIVGDKVPASLQFDLTQQQDFMPEIALGSSGDLASGQTWTWRPVDRAKGYFLHAMGMQGDAMVFWSSSEIADAGMGMFDYLPPATVEKWIREKVVLAPSVTSCAMPAGIFAGNDNQSAGGMMQMIAFGPESHIAYPPKPADPKAPWTPEWNVRVRNKSTATAMLGMSLDASQKAEQNTPQQPEQSKASRLLRGILGR